MNMLNQENMSSDVRETSKRIVKDFLNEQYTPFSESVSVCTVADVSCSKAHAKEMGKMLCNLWNQANIQGSNFRYDYLEESQTARFTFIAPLTLTEKALSVLHQEL